MAKAARHPAEVLLDQSRTVLAWLEQLPEDAFARASVLPEWSVAELTGHLVFAHRTLLDALGRPTRQPALPIADYVRGYRPNADTISAASREVAAVAAGPAVVKQLAAAVAACATAFAELGRRTVVLGPRGPITTEDLLDTRIVELIVHSDDLSRSLPDRVPVARERDAFARCTRTLAAILAGQHPGRSVEVRIPPYAAVQCAIAAGGRGDLGPDPHPGHTAQCRRDRPGDLLPAGDRPDHLGRGRTRRRGACLRPARRPVGRAATAS